jgi:hypothetical protein
MKCDQFLSLRCISQVFTLLVVSCLLYIIDDGQVYAAPEDRGAMGSSYALSGGGYVVTGEDGEGVRLPSQYGYSLGLFLGEEVLPKIFVGVHFDVHLDEFAGGEEPSKSQMFAFGLEGRARLTGDARGLLLLGGIGIGAGGFIAAGESLTDAEASSGGSIWKLGLGYELGGKQVTGLTYIPKLTFQRLGPQMESSVSINVIALSVEVLYGAGR